MSKHKPGTAGLYLFATIKADYSPATMLKNVFEG